MAVHFTFAASKVPKSVPCVGNSLSLTELKDAIAAPLVAALHGKKLKEQFDFRVYDADTKEEIVGASSRVRKNASVVVKRVPAFVVSQQQRLLPVEVSLKGLKVDSNKSTVNTFDDGFGEDVYSHSSVSTVSTVSIPKISRKEISRNVRRQRVEVDNSLADVHSRSTRSTVSSEEVEKVGNSTEKEEDVAWSGSFGDIPVELMCSLCKSVMKDPMLITCCCKSFCHNCIKVALVQGKACPDCKSVKCTEANLLPNRHVKSLVDAYVKSNSSVSSSGSCSSQTSSFQAIVTNFPKEKPSTTLRALPSKTQSALPSKTQSAMPSKRKPFVISLNDGAKRTKVM